MDAKKTLWNFFDTLEGDKVVWLITILLFLSSIVCLFSSTSRLLSAGQTRLDIVRGQIILATVGMGIIVLLYNIRDVRILRWFSGWGFVISLILLGLLVCRINTPFIRAIEVNGAWRILSIKGVQIHVFEVVKVAMVLYLAAVQDAIRKGEIKFRKLDVKWQKRIFVYLPFILTILLLMTGSNSAALFTGFIMFLVILFGGGNFKELGLLAAVSAGVLLCCLGIWKISSGKLFSRVGTGVSRIFEDTDWEAKAMEARFGSKDFYDALDEIRQPYSAKIAIHQGSILGKGPGESEQRYIVPDMPEDYMYSFIIEEYGIMGGILVILLYVSLLARGAIIARNCGTNLFASLAVGGLSLLITGQAFLHMMVNVDIGPMTGQTLPLISHGNSAFLCFSVALGVILSISRSASKLVEKDQEDAGSLLTEDSTPKEKEYFEEAAEYESL